MSIENLSEQQSQIEATAPSPTLDAIAEFLHQEYVGLGYQDFAANLEAHGLLSPLEQTGILSNAADPQQREATFRQLYLGVVLAHLKPDLLISPTLMFSPTELNFEE